VIFNIIISIIIILLVVFIPFDEIISIFIIYLSILGFLVGISNILPLKQDAGTDGCKILSLYKNEQVHEYFYNLSVIKCKLLKGIRMKDMPQNLLNIPNEVNFNNPIFVEIKINKAEQYYDNMEYDKAEEIYKSLLPINIKLSGFYKNEILCQLLYFEIIKGNEEEVAKLMTKNLKQYIKALSKNITKKRLMYAYTVLIEKKPLKSEDIWHDFHDTAKNSLIEGEIESESETMNYIKQLGIEKGIL